MLDPLLDALWQQSQYPKSQVITQLSGLALLVGLLFASVKLDMKWPGFTAGAVAIALSLLALGMRLAAGDFFLGFYLVGHTYWLLVLWVPILVAFEGWPGRLYAALGATTFVYSYLWAPNQLEVTRYALSLPDAPSARIALVADLQANGRSAREPQLIEALQAAEPDLVLFAGDYLNGIWAYHPTSFAAAREVLQAVDVPGFAVTGHMDTPLGHRKLFEGTQVTLLRNQAATVALGGKQVVIWGLDQLVPDPSVPPPAGDVTLALFHAPDHIRTFDPALVDLALAGHTHGGQLALPGFGPLTALTSLGRDFARGLFEVDDTWLVVSAGIGIEGLFSPPIRTFCPPELVLIDLSPGPREVQVGEVRARRHFEPLDPASLGAADPVRPVRWVGDGGYGLDPATFDGE